MTRDPRIDAYIERAKPFARPILAAIRDRVHAAFPSVREDLKWGHPAFLKEDKILLGMAAFKAHAAINFWRAGELGIATNLEAMGQAGRLTAVEELPGDLERWVAAAAALADSRPARRVPKHPPRPAPDLHPQFAAALDRSPTAKAAFDSFAPSHRREYCEWIAEAKRDETRARRIDQAIGWLAEGKKRNWKYEGC